LFDSQGNISSQDLTYEDGTGVLSDDGNTMPTNLRLLHVVHATDENGVDLA